MNRRMDSSAGRTRLTGSLRQSEHRERSAERGVVAKGSVTADGAKTGGVHVPLGGFQCTAHRCTARSVLPFSRTLRAHQPGRQADTGPAAHAGQHGYLLPATLLKGRDVADDAGRGLELVELLARLGIDRLEVTFKGSVEHHAAGSGERA